MSMANWGRCSALASAPRPLDPAATGSAALAKKNGTPAPKTGGRPRHAVPTDSALQKREYRERKAIRGALMGAAAAIVAAAAVAESF